MPPRSKKAQSKRERPSDEALFAEKEAEVQQRLADIELEGAPCRDSFVQARRRFQG
jgi:hypothetical protein